MKSNKKIKARGEPRWPKPFIFHLGWQIIAFIFLTVVCQPTYGQNKQSGLSSEQLVTFDYTNPETKTDVPFDKRFTFRVLHFNTKNIKHVYAYETEFYNGKRNLKTDYNVWVPNSNGQLVANPQSVYDFELEHKETKDTLNLYFPPLKPSKEFEIAVDRGLSNDNLATLYKVNQALFIGDHAAAYDQFRKLLDNSYNSVFDLSFFNYNDLGEYELAFNSTFRIFYQGLHTLANYPDAPFLTVNDLNLIETGFTAKKIKFKEGYYLVRSITEINQTALFKGFLPANYTSTTVRAEEGDYAGRISNLKQTIAVFDTLYRNINTYLALENALPIIPLRNIVYNDIVQLKANQAFFEDQFSKLNKAITADENLAEVDLLIGDTNAKDIKTQGTNIFTLDAGLAGITTWNPRNRTAFLPKLYWGVNIYFRPIDKNTRRETLPSGLIPNYTNGPDYNIESQKSIWQNLCLTLGFTTGSYANKDFDNLFNNTTLLIGGGYRFARAFKITAGTALLRRVSNNPVITDKSVCFGPFVSFSVDIDLIQGLKDITSILFK